MEKKNLNTQDKLQEALKLARRLEAKTETAEGKVDTSANENVKDKTNDASAKENTKAETKGPIDESRFYAGPINALAKAYQKNQGFLSKMFMVAAWPITNIVWPLAKKYAKAFNWAAKSPHPVTKKPRYTMTGVTAALAATLLFAGFMRVAVPSAYDTAISLTDKTEELYISGVETIEDGEVYAVCACEELPCTPENSIYFHIEEDWGLVHPEFFPEELAGGIPSEVSFGKVTHNGIRIKTPFFRKYREIKDYELTPLNELPEDHPARLSASKKQLELEKEIEIAEPLFEFNQ